MTQGGILLGSKKYLAWVALALLALLVLLSPKAYAGAESGGGRACSTSLPPTPYTNGAPVVRAFYPADGSTVTVTSTGAVIKQSPCQTPYREGWINPDNICHLNAFSDLGGMMSTSSSNPNPNTDPVYSCDTNPPAMNTVTAPPATAPVNSNNVNVVQTVTTPPAPVRPTETPGVVKSQTTSNPAPAATALPNTGPNGVLAVGSISTVLGSVGHFFYRRRNS